MSPLWTRCCCSSGGVKAAAVAQCLRPRGGPLRSGHAWGGHPLRSGHALGGHPLPSDIAGGSLRGPAAGRARPAAGPWRRGSHAARGSPADVQTWWWWTVSIAPRMAGLAGTPMGAQSRLWARGFTTQRGEVAEKPAVGTAAQQAQAAGSTKKPDPPIAESVGTPSKAQQLKRVFKEYGAVGVVFHISISLVSLGICYLAVSSGLDVEALLRKLGVGEAFLSSRAATGTSTFVLAYAMHKVMAPARISITLVSVPLLVRYLRRVGLFRPPVPKP
ncbi:protein FAM210B, mitochondrial [Petromyzon marinus]|uniref:protein FAM210B, mitochondrial n=1 Tax=Petromyzon marinus TaxID=7757 RepID=UPI003F70D5B4